MTPLPCLHRSVRNGHPAPRHTRPPSGRCENLSRASGPQPFGAPDRTASAVLWRKLRASRLARSSASPRTRLGPESAPPRRTSPLLREDPCVAARRSHTARWGPHAAAPGYHGLQEPDGRPPPAGRRAKITAVVGRTADSSDNGPHRVAGYRYC